MDNSSTTRFSNRVANYVRYRPRYPEEVGIVLQNEYSLDESSVVADVGSGTGISTELLLSLGCTTNAVEPNDEMRAAAEQQLGQHPKFRSIHGTAEATTLDGESQGFVFAAQAFHWFDKPKAQREFRRILKPNGIVVLCWNERLTTGTPFLEDYEQLLLDFATNYVQVDHSQVTVEDINAFLESACDLREFDNSQEFDFEGLQGRLLSSSYAPTDGANFQPMLDQLQNIFDRFQENDRVNFLYKTKLYVGRFGRK